MSAYSLFEIMGLMVQKDLISTPEFTTIFIVLLVVFIFYCFAVYWAFQAYKEFKAIHYDIGGQMSRGISYLNRGSGSG